MTVDMPNTGLSPVACTLIAVVVWANVADTLNPDPLLGGRASWWLAGFPSMSEGDGYLMANR